MIYSFFIKSSFGKIFSILHRGDINKPLIVLVHGHKGNHLGNNYRIFVKLANYLYNYGYNVLRFDFIGSGNSDDGDTRISSMVNQLTFIVNYFLEKYDFNKTILVGHSRGFWISMLAYEKIKNIVGLVSLCGRIRNLKYFLSQMEIDYLLKTDKNFEKILEDDSKYDYKEVISKIKIPVLLIYGKNDSVIYYTEAFEFMKYYKGNRLSIKIFNDLDHRIKDKIEEISIEIINFIKSI